MNKLIPVLLIACLTCLGMTALLTGGSVILWNENNGLVIKGNRTVELKEPSRSIPVKK